ncbi:MAG: HEAT repeat domain-containing protein [Microcystaceae cyanobacterium]
MSDTQETPIAEGITDPKLEQSATPSPLTASNGAAREIQWREISRTILKQTQPINPLTTQPDEFNAKRGHCFVNLLLSDENDLQTPEAFFDAYFFPRPYSPYRIAFIGTAGTGKTLILQRLAQWLSDQDYGIPIWISARELGTLSLSDYLYQKWLPKVVKLSKESPEDLEKSLRELIPTGQLWLLLDGMDFIKLSDQTTPFSTLGRVMQDLQYWGQTVNIALNCRNQTWQGIAAGELYDRRGKFDCYSTRELTYTREVQQFIEEWFQNTSFSSQKQELSHSLIRNLATVNVEAIQQAITNPLRLSLLCRWWPQQSSTFPNSLTELYGILVQEYYQWKAETTALSRKSQEELNQWLGEIALKQLETEKLLIIPENESSELALTLALQLEWLVPLPEEHTYIFNDETFVAYFAAQMIGQGDDFLEKYQENIAYSANITFLSPNWSTVLNFWLGRGDIPTEAKDTLIQKLSSFSDGCDPSNFYGKLAYCLAGASLANFPHTHQGQAIIDQLIRWAFSPTPDQKFLVKPALESLGQTHRELAIKRLIESFLRQQPPNMTDEAWRWLAKKGVDHPVAITILSQMIEEKSSFALCVAAAECLGKISSGHPLALSVFINLLKATEDKLRWIALKGLAKIGNQQPLAITALVKYLTLLRDSSQQRRVFQCLEKIGQRNDLAIASMVQLLRCSSDTHFQRMAAECLEKIDSGNTIAITILVELLEEKQTEEIRRMAVYSLGEVESGNEVAIHGLVQLLSQSHDVLTRWVAVSSLGKIGKDSPEAINSLVKLINSSDSLLLRKEAVESLGKLDATHPTAIATLAKWIQVGNEESLRREAAESLGKLDPGNPEAITALVHLLQTADDPFTRRQAAASLGRIDSGNLEAINTLVQLIKTSQDTDIQSLAADSLGELGANNPAVIATLIRLLTATKDQDTLRRTASSLAKVGKGNREVIATMMELLTNGLQGDSTEATRLELAESLTKILYPNQIRQIIPFLKAFLSEPHHQSDLPCQELLWHCVQQLTYTEFYQVWHQDNLASVSNAQVSESVGGINGDSTEVWVNKLNTDLQNNPNLSQKVHLICIDSGDFLDLENPTVDVYEQMLAQGCPDFSHGIPETLSMLRLYWQLLRRDYPEKTFIFIFYGTLINDPTLKPFWQLLSKFHSQIAIVGESKINTLTHFSLDNPQLMTEILTWIENSLN